MEWTEKYRPNSLDEIVGNGEAAKKLREWAERWKPGGKAALLFGPPGSGKTSAAHALAREKGWEILELNASDTRDAERIRQIVGSASCQKPLFGEPRKLILMDEADNIHGKADRGGSGALISIIGQSKHPIVLTANDMWAISPQLRAVCEPIRFFKIRKNLIISVLEKICKNEGVKFSKEVLSKIAENASGDLRAAINDLEAISLGRREIEDVVVGRRDAEQTMFTVLLKVFRGKNMKDALHAFQMCGDEPANLIRWIGENLPLEYRGDDLRRALGHLSRADVYLGRTQRSQNYSLWKYATEVAIGGVQSSKSQTPGGKASYRRPAWLKGETSAIVEALSKALSISIEEARTLIPVIDALSPKDRKSVEKWLGISS